MDVNQHYRAPESSLTERNMQHVGGSVEAALAGEVSWSIGEVLSSAWQQVSGYKGTFWLAMLVYVVIVIALSVVQMALISVVDNVVIAALSEFAVNLALMPLFVGLLMLGIRRAGNADISASSIMDYYPKIVPIIVLNLVMVLMIMVGFLLLILPGIYLSIAYALAFPLLIDKNMGVWEALETSRKAISKCWFRYFGLMIVVILMLMLATIPLGIGLIWGLPLASMVLGVVYVKLFGYETAP
jgi:uncharacterized membrane protein